MNEFQRCMESALGYLSLNAPRRLGRIGKCSHLIFRARDEVLEIRIEIYQRLENGNPLAYGRVSRQAEP